MRQASNKFQRQIWFNDKEFAVTCDEVTELIVLQKLRKQLEWPQLAEVIGKSKEWTTAALL
jgi:cyanate lyase